MLMMCYALIFSNIARRINEKDKNLSSHGFLFQQERLMTGKRNRQKVYTLLMVSIKETKKTDVLE